MRVLILHQFKNHSELIESLCTKLNTKDIETNSFNIATWELGNTATKLPITLQILRFLLFNYKLRLYFFKNFPQFFESFYNKFDIVDINFFGNFYAKTINILKRKKIKSKITVWGSDFYRSTIANRETQRLSYNKVDKIQVATSQMRSDFLNYYPEFENKMHLGHFGITNFEHIEAIKKSESIQSIREKFCIPEDKIVITCGYNGSEGQQHFLMLNAIDKLEDTLKDKIFILLPMTYGAKIDVLHTVKDYLNNSSVKYLILSEELDTFDVCRLRLLSDITVNVQITDAFSASIQEHLKADNVVIVGEWLPYKKLEDHDVFYIKCNKENLLDKIIETIDNYDYYKKLSENNSIKIENVTSWDAAVNNWINVYHELIN